MASSPSNENVNRQLPLTVTAQCPLRLPFSGCHPHPSRFISSGVDARFRVVSRIRSRDACFGCMPAFEPVRKNLSTPLCLKDLITEIERNISCYRDQRFCSGTCRFFPGIGGQPCDCPWNSATAFSYRLPSASCTAKRRGCWAEPLHSDTPAYAPSLRRM